MKEWMHTQHEFWRNDRSLSVLLGLLILTVFVASPVALATRAEAAVHIAFSLLLLGGLTVFSRRLFLGAVVVVVCAIAVVWLGRWFNIPGLDIAELVLNGVFVAAIMVVVLTRSVGRGEVTAHRISGVVAAYLLCALLFAQAFALVETLNPGSFTADAGLLESAGGWSGFLYFSMVTLSTVGYGDLTPVHPTARSLASFEAFVGQLYPAILIARMVALRITNKKDHALPSS